jgi:hypothetical protein
MSSILKVDEIQDTSGNNIINESSDTITIGASGDTISIPSGATIANSGTATGFGKVLQVVSTSTTSAVGTTSTSFVDINLSLNITPSATSSKIFVIYTGTNETNGTTGQRLNLRMLRDATEIADSNVIGNITPANGVVTSASISKLDEPSTNSEITYKMQGNSHDGTVVVFNLGSSTGTLTAFEIEG